MTKYRDEDGNEKAECNYCKKTFDPSSKKGTTHLKNHLDRSRAKGKGTGGDEDKSDIARDQEEKEMAEVQEQNVGSSSSNRPKRSKVWSEMTKYRDKDGNKKAECKYCKKTFDGSSKKGTTHLKNHLERCRAKRKGGGHEDKTVTTGDSANTIVIKERSPIDQINHSIDAERFTTERCGPSILNSRKVQISLGVPMESPQSVVSIFKSLLLLSLRSINLISLLPLASVFLKFIYIARDIHDIGVYHKQDVYATLCLTSDPENTVTTKIIYAGGSNPVFNESRQLKVKTVDSSLKSEIFTQDLFSCLFDMLQMNFN